MIHIIEYIHNYISYFIFYFSDFIGSKKNFYPKMYDILSFSFVLCEKMKEKKFMKNSTNQHCSPDWSH